MRNIFFATIFLITASLARAVPIGTVEIEYTGLGAKGQLKVWGGGFCGSSVPGGVYMFDKTAGAGAGDLWPNGPLGGFCIELSERAPQNNPYQYDVVMPEEAQRPTDFLGDYIGLDKAGYLRELWGRFFDPNWIGSGSFTCKQKSDAEAFAAAVWEIVYEKLPASPAGWDVTVDGTLGRLGFMCSDADTHTANAWLHSLDGSGPKADLRAVVFDGKQDYLVAVPVTEVPEPATIALLGLGALSLVRRKK
jgi:hypothetical protein